MLVALSNRLVPCSPRHQQERDRAKAGLDQKRDAENGEHGLNALSLEVIAHLHPHLVEVVGDSSEAERVNVYDDDQENDQLHCENGGDEVQRPRAEHRHVAGALRRRRRSSPRADQRKQDGPAALVRSVIACRRVDVRGCIRVARSRVGGSNGCLAHALAVQYAILSGRMVAVSLTPLNPPLKKGGR